MNTLTQLKRRIIEYLGGLTAFENVTILAAFSGLQRQYPVKEPVIVVSLQSVELADSGLGGYLGGDDLQYGRAALITLGFAILCPKAEDCDTFYEALCNALLEADWAGFTKITGGSLEYDAKTAAFQIPASAVLRANWIIDKQEERLFTGVNLTINND